MRFWDTLLVSAAALLLVACGSTRVLTEVELREKALIDLNATMHALNEELDAVRSQQLLLPKGSPRYLSVGRKVALLNEKSSNFALEWEGKQMDLEEARRKAAEAATAVTNAPPATETPEPSPNPPSTPPATETPEPSPNLPSTNSIAQEITIGSLLWEFETGNRVHSSPVLGSDGTVYVGSRDNKLYAIHGKTGVKLWEFETGNEVSSSPAIGSDGTVYVGSDDFKLYAINGKTGVKLWEFETGNEVSSSPAIGFDGTVYVGSDDKKLYAINGKSGVKLWEFETGSKYEFSSPAIGSDGTVYAGSEDNKLYAIKPEKKSISAGNEQMSNEKLKKSIVGVYESEKITEFGKFKLKNRIVIRPDGTRVDIATQTDGRKLWWTDPRPNGPNSHVFYMNWSVRNGTVLFKTKFHGETTGKLTDKKLVISQGNMEYVFNKIPVSLEWRTWSAPGEELVGGDGLDSSTLTIQALIRKNIHKTPGEKLLKEDYQKVESLQISDEQITSLVELGKLSNITSLGINGCQLKSTDGLGELSSLLSLNLVDNRLTSLDSLEKLTKLKSLFLYKNDKITKLQIEKLQKELPNCSIRHETTD